HGGRAVDHVGETVGGVVTSELVQPYPAGVGGVARRLEHAARGLGHVVHDDPVIADARAIAGRRGIADDAVDHPAHVEDVDLEAAFLLDLAAHRVLEPLAQVHEAAGQAPLALRRRPAALDQQDTVALEQDGPHADPRRVGILAGRVGHGVATGRGARATTRPTRVHSAVPYLSRVSVSMRATSPSASPPGSSVTPWTRRNPSARRACVSPKLGRRPSTPSSVVMPASGSRLLGNTRASRAGSAPSITAPCCRKPAACRRCALPTTLGPPASSSYEPVRAKQNAGMLRGSEGCTDTIATGPPRPSSPASRARPIH